MYAKLKLGNYLTQHLGNCTKKMLDKIVNTKNRINNTQGCY